MTELFATKIPPTASFLDIIRALEPLGPIDHITILKKEITGKPGQEQQSAFLSYKDEETANHVLEYGNSSQKGKSITEQMLSDKIIHIHDEPIIIIPQKPREEILDRMAKKDRRNIHLAYEGHIKPDDPQAEGVAPEEMAKRKKLFDDKMKKLADTNFSVVPTRLAIFNVPEEVHAGRLRKIFAVAAERYARNHKDKDFCQKALKKSVRITEVRPVESQPGLFFMEFTTHEHALCALKQTNNNPEYFKTRRMIVEFAVTSSFATKERRRREQAKKEAREKRRQQKESYTSIQYGDEPEPDSDEEADE